MILCFAAHIQIRLLRLLTSLAHDLTLFLPSDSAPLGGQCFDDSSRYLVMTAVRAAWRGRLGGRGRGGGRLPRGRAHVRHERRRRPACFQRGPHSRRCLLPITQYWVQGRHRRPPPHTSVRLYVGCGFRTAASHPNCPICPVPQLLDPAWPNPTLPPPPPPRRVTKIWPREGRRSPGTPFPKLKTPRICPTIF